MKNVTLLLLIILLVMPMMGESEKAEAKATLQGLEAFVDGVMTSQLSSYRVAGAAVSIVKDGQVLLCKGYGYADAKKRAPVDGRSTIFRIGSVSKIFTWMAIMKLREQGKLSLEDDVNQHLQGLQIPETFKEPIRIRHLLTHTAGFEEKINSYASQSIEDVGTISDFVGHNIPLRVNPVGTVCSYSNYGAVLAGYIVEELSNRSFNEFIEAHFFKSMGMGSSSFNQVLSDEAQKRLSKAHSFQLGQFKEEDLLIFNGVEPAGSMSTTAFDMANFMNHWLNPVDSALGVKRETLKQMESVLFSPHKELNGMAHGLWEKQINGLRALEHAGDTFYFHALLDLIPEQRLGIFVVYNSMESEGLPSARFEFVKSVMDRYFPKSFGQEIHPPKGSEERISKVAGTYLPLRSNWGSFEKIINLFSQTSVKQYGQSEIVFRDHIWQEVSPYLFQKKGTEEKIAFKIDAEKGGVFLIRDMIPVHSFTKLTWCKSGLFYLALFLVALVVFIYFIAGGVNRGVKRLFKREKSKVSDVTRLSTYLSFVYLFFLILLITVMKDVIQIIYSVPLLLKVALVFPVIGVVLTLLLIFKCVKSWSLSLDSLKERIWSGLMVAASLLFLLQLYTVNLLGFHF